MRNAIRSAVHHLRTQGVWVVLGRIYLSGGALLSSVLLARLMERDEMGVYRLVMSGINLVSALALPGVFEVLIRHMPRGEFHIYPHLFIYRIKVSILAMIGFVVFCFFTFDLHSRDEVISLGLIALMLPLYLSSQMYEAGYQAQMKFRELSTIYVGRTTMLLVGYLGAYLILGSVYTSLAVMIGVMTAYHYWNHLRLKRDLAMQETEAAAPLGVASREALWISIFTILPTVMENIDKILVERSSGLDRLAVYSVGIALGLAINTFFKPFLNSINAKLVHRTPSAQHYLIVIVGGTLIGGVVSLLSPYLVPFMYGDSYAESVPFSVIVTMSMGLYLWKTLYFNHAMFNSRKKLKVVYFSNIAMASCAIAYMLMVVIFVQDQDRLMLAFALAYPLKMIFSILSLWVFGRLFR